ncbi:MAG: ATP synthase F1 subunit epsilon [Lachnospiraceae bacterium]|nr:ATP synthase F1 subunit epsilon [Lachnospiraceae bacterium]
MANERDFTLRIITPDRTFYEGEVQMVEFNTTEGEIGVLKDHIPMTVLVSPGVLTITLEEETKTAALHAGFAEILGDRVTILAEIIEWPHEIDESRAEKAKARAEERLQLRAEDLDVKRAEISLRRAITRIQVTK